jgi:beta-glucosidase/6-phospho-beta-glucosidase/beta-galactosidase
VAFYNAVIDSMIENGISPAATLYHWDIPQTNQDEYKVGEGDTEGAVTGRGRVRCVCVCMHARVRVHVIQRM